MINFTICIPTFNRSEDLKRLLISLVFQTHKSFEVIVINNNSNDDTENICNQFKKNLSLLHINKKTSLAEAQNIALNNAKGIYFLRTDDDAEFETNSLEIILSTFSANQQIGGVSLITETIDKKKRNYFKFYNYIIKIKPKLICKFIIYIIYGRNFFSINKFNECGVRSFGANTFLVRRNKSKIFFVDDLEAISLCFRKDLLLNVGGFDERYLGIGEFSEADVCVKIKKKSLLVINTTSSIKHYVSTGGMYGKRNYCHDRIYNFSLFYYLHFNKSVVAKVRFFVQIFLYFNFFLLNSIYNKNFDILNFFPAIYKAKKIVK
jgi:glycosyltransferase involved in cell wall biosynthesis